MKGFTLVELMVVVAIAALLMLVAGPSFLAFQRDSDLSSLASDLTASLNMARSESMKRARHVTVTPREAHWFSGWRVFVDLNRNGVLDAGELVLSEMVPPPRGDYSFTGTEVAAAADGPYIMFDGSGYSRTRSGGFASATITMRDVSSSASRKVKVANTGRVRSCKPKNASDSTCSDDED
jgi:type IV fimbrial biogenesis protein FimT